MIKVHKTIQSDKITVFVNDRVFGFYSDIFTACLHLTESFKKDEISVDCEIMKAIIQGLELPTRKKIEKIKDKQSS